MMTAWRERDGFAARQRDGLEFAHLHHVPVIVVRMCVWISIGARRVAARADQVDRRFAVIDDVEVPGRDVEAGRRRAHPRVRRR